MIIGTTQSIVLLIMSFLAIALLLKILMYVHRQQRHVKELELRMSAMEKLNAEGITESQTTEDTKGE